MTCKLSPKKTPKRSLHSWQIYCSKKCFFAKLASVRMINIPNVIYMEISTYYLLEKNLKGLTSAFLKIFAYFSSFDGLVQSAERKSPIAEQSRASKYLLPIWPEGRRFQSCCQLFLFQYFVMEEREA